MKLSRRMLTTGAALLVAAGMYVPTAARWIDQHWLGSALKDTWGWIRWNEDWDNAMPLPTGLDSTWLDSAQRPIRIAHALGASGTASANTLEALAVAAAEGFRLFEVDLWLDDEGELRCQHDGDTRPPLQPGDCTLRRLLPLIAQVGGWVVLDIKSDFRAAGNKVLELVKLDGLASHVVFQLYHADQVELFGQWGRQVPLALPIVTVYGSHRSGQHIADHMQKINGKALALPLDSMEFLHRRPRGVVLLVHPVHSCRERKAAESGGSDGSYTVVGVVCGTEPHP